MMPGPVICAKCGKFLSNAEMDHGHRCILEYFAWNSKIKLEQTHEQRDSPLLKCPRCNKISLFWNPRFFLYECLNLKCKKRLSADELKIRDEADPS